MSRTPRVMSAREMLAARRRQDVETRKLFDYIDEDDSGTIEFDELYNALRSAGSGMSKDALQLEWDVIDADESGCLEFNEFKRLMTAKFADDGDLKAKIQRILGSKQKELAGASAAAAGPPPKVTRVLSSRAAMGISAGSVRADRKKRREIEAKAKRVFDAIDVDHSGAVDFEELWHAVHKIDPLISKRALSKEFDFIDEDGSHEIEFPEFVKFWTRLNPKGPTAMRPMSATAAESGAGFKFGGELPPDAMLVTRLQRALCTDTTLKPSIAAKQKRALAKVGPDAAERRKRKKKAEMAAAGSSSTERKRRKKDATSATATSSGSESRRRRKKEAASGSGSKPRSDRKRRRKREERHH